MNSYTERMKKAILEYQKTAKAASDKIAEVEQLYKPEEAAKERERILAKLTTEQERVLACITEAASEGQRAAAAWGRLDGSKITPDAELLRAGTVKPAQFAEMVERYQDNGTMMQLLSDYAEKRNAETGGGFEAKWGFTRRPADITGQVFRPDEVQYFDTSRIPTVQGRQMDLEKSAKAAASIVKSMSDFTPGFGHGPGSEMIQTAIQNFGI